MMLLSVCQRNHRQNLDLSACVETTNLAYFLKDKDSSISTVWPFSLCSRSGCSRGAQRSEDQRRCRYWCVREDEESRESWRMEVSKGGYLHQPRTSISSISGSENLRSWCLLNWILHVSVDVQKSCLSAGGGFSITCWSQPELHAAFQNERDKWTVHENTSDIFSWVTCSQRRAEQSRRGNFRGTFQYSYARFNLSDFNLYCQVRSRRKNITSARTSQGVWTSLQEQNRTRTSFTWR